MVAGDSEPNDRRQLLWHPAKKPPTMLLSEGIIAAPPLILTVVVKASDSASCFKYRAFRLLEDTVPPPPPSPPPFSSGCALVPFFRHCSTHPRSYNSGSHLIRNLNMHSITSLGLTLLASSGLALAAPVQQSKRQSDSIDLGIFQFAHVLEQLEAGFYMQGIMMFQDADFMDAGFVSAELVTEQLTVIQGDESTHVSILEEEITALGGTPLVCKFDFTSLLTDVGTMLTVARALEFVGVSAYLGAASLMSDKQLLLDAASILTVEARHQTLLNVFNGGAAIPQAFDIPLSPEQVLAIAAPFITGPCDLGITGNMPLMISNSGSLAPGDAVDMSWGSGSMTAASNGAGLFCQFISGGLPVAVAMNLTECMVPPGIEGPMYIFITNTSQPLQNNLVTQFTGSIVAGPALMFIDMTTEIISEIIRTTSTTSVVIPPMTVGMGSSPTGSQGSGGVTVMGWSMVSPNMTIPMATTMPVANMTMPMVHNMTMPMVTNMTMPMVHNMTMPKVTNMTMPMLHNMTMPLVHNMTMPLVHNMTMPAPADNSPS